MTEASIQVRDDKGRFVRRKKVVISRERATAFIVGLIAGAVAGVIAVAGM